jgi:Ca-activated chloride channel family protein
MTVQKSVIGVLTCATLATAPPALLAADGPLFKTNTRVVAVSSTVTDTDNRIVLNLTKDDFEVLDNNRQQPLTFFEPTLVPIRVVVMLDTSASMLGTIPTLRAAAREFVARLQPDDTCLVGAFNDGVQFGREFTADRDRLVADIESLEAGDTTHLYDAIDASVEKLTGAPDRRVILVLTDGADTDSDTSLRHVIDRARSNGVMVYAIGLERPVYRQRPVSEPDKGLKKLADETGGGYFTLTKTTDLTAAFTRVADELHSQYLMGFSPERLDGRVHSLVVRVKRPGLTARARRSYVAADAPATARRER